MFSNAHTITQLADAAYIEEISKYLNPKPDVLMPMNDRLHTEIEGIAKTFGWSTARTYQQALDTFVDHFAPLGPQALEELDVQTVKARQLGWTPKLPHGPETPTVRIDPTLKECFEDYCEVMNVSEDDIWDKMLEGFLLEKGLGDMQAFITAIEAEKPTSYQRRLLKRMPKNKALLERLVFLARRYIAAYMGD